jgi:hypothetical protein
VKRAGAEATRPSARERSLATPRWRALSQPSARLHWIVVEDATLDNLKQTEQWLAEQRAPEVGKGAFICPSCYAYAHQEWFDVSIGTPLGYQGIGSRVSKCAQCNNYAYWVGDQLVYPPKRQGPAPHPEMPEEPRADYNEAREIVGLSPRGACALLRLALQKLSKELGEKGKDLNTDIGNLVKKGLGVQIQQALDSVRVIGNNSVHPGEFDVTDDSKTATTLFECMNLIVEQMISQPRRMSELYGKLPQGAKDQIEARDKSGAKT